VSTRNSIALTKVDEYRVVARCDSSVADLVLDSYGWAVHARRPGKRRAETVARLDGPGTHLNQAVRLLCDMVAQMAAQDLPDAHHVTAAVGA
jgi:hypothetical protein